MEPSSSEPDTRQGQYVNGRRFIVITSEEYIAYLRSELYFNDKIVIKDEDGPPTPKPPPRGPYR